MSNSTAAEMIEHGTMTVDVQSSQTEAESYIDYSRIMMLVLMILWLTALILIVMIIIPFVRAMRRRDVAASLVTHDGQADETVTRVKCDDDEEDPVEIKTENIIISEQEQQERHFEVEVQHRQLPTEKMPKGILTVLALLIALSLSVATQTSCRYISSSSPAMYMYLDNRVVKVRTFGLWSAAIYDGSVGSADQCQSIFLNGFPIDRTIVIARVAAIVASVLGSIALIATLRYAMSGRLGSLGFLRVSWALTLATFAQALVMIIQSAYLCDSGDVCELDGGAFFSITASVYWFIADLSIIFVHFESVYISTMTLMAASANRP